MKILYLYCNKFSYELHHPTKVAEKEPNNKSSKHDNSLVAFIAIEDGDDLKVVNAAAKETRKLARKVPCDGDCCIIVNPFAHLTTNLADSDKATELLHAFTDRISSTWDGDVEYSSFGWYKSFKIDVSGEDNTQIFRSF